MPQLVRAHLIREYNHFGKVDKIMLGFNMLER